MSKYNAFLKRGSRSSKTNYRPVSILPVISKSLKTLSVSSFTASLIIYCQSVNVVSEKVSVHNIVYLSSAHRIVYLCCLNFGNKPTQTYELSKAFVCLNHCLLIVKLHVCGLKPISIETTSRWFKLLG